MIQMDQRPRIPVPLQFSGARDATGYPLTIGELYGWWGGAFSVLELGEAIGEVCLEKIIERTEGK